LSFVIHRHEPWFDEAQAWLLARDASLPDLLLHRLRYEGSPGLWHCLLAILAKIGLPYASMNWLAGVLGSANAFLVFLYAPFPAWLRYTLPFTFFLFYQYAVVARSYVLLPLLLFCIARIYWDASNRLVALTILLALLANVSVHGCLLSLAIVASTIWRVRPVWLTLKSSQKRAYALALILFGLVIGLLFLQLRKPPDLTDFGTLNFGAKHLISVTALNLKNAFTGSFLLSGFVLVVSAWWFYTRRTLLLFLSGAAVVSALAGVVYSNVWHEGVLLCWWVFVMWVSGTPKARPMPRLVLSACVVLIAIQVFWALRTSWFDLRFPYSGSQALAQYFVGQNLERENVYALGWKNAAMLPYFRGPAFANWPSSHCYWLWSSKNGVRNKELDLSKPRPRFVILAISNDSDPETVSRREMLSRLNYSLARRFDGALYWKSRVLELDGYEVYRAEP
jgi:hypothetical protein